MQKHHDIYRTYLHETTRSVSQAILVKLICIHMLHSFTSVLCAFSLLSFQFPHEKICTAQKKKLNSFEILLVKYLNGFPCIITSIGIMYCRVGVGHKWEISMYLFIYLFITQETLFPPFMHGIMRLPVSQSATNMHQPALGYLSLYLVPGVHMLMSIAMIQEKT